MDGMLSLRSHGSPPGAPSVVERRLLGLRCSCGGDAIRIHLVDPRYADAPPWPVGDAGPDTAPRGRRSVARPCCPAHTMDGLWVTVDGVAADWSGQLARLAAAEWRGDLALRALVDEAGPA